MEVWAPNMGIEPFLEALFRGVLGALMATYMVYTGLSADAGGHRWMFRK